MGWRGAMRSAIAVSRQMQRESERRRKHEHKLQLARDAANAVGAWEEYLEDIQSLHIDSAKKIDWEKIASTPPPREPVKSTRNEDKALSRLANFRPGLLDVFRGGSAKRKLALEIDVESAAAADEIEFQKRHQDYQSEYADWLTEHELAKGVLGKHVNATKKVLSEYQGLTSSYLIGTHMEFIIGDGFLHVRPQVHGDDIIPRYRRKQLASGKLSETKMPISQFNELYQDYVSSVALKVAGDIFKILPHNEIYVTCMTEMLNTATGHQEITPILSVQFVRETISRLDLRRIDPSDCLSNFNHKMNFKKTKGFSAIEPLVDDPTST